MKVLLVCPQENIPRTGEGYPSGALLLLGSTLRSRGHDVSVVQMITDRVDPQGLGARVREFKPDVVGITMNTYQTRSAREASRAVKLVGRGILVVTGGPHPSALGMQTFHDFPEVDVVVVGEGEEAITEIAEGTPLGLIRGLCLPDGPTAPRPLRQDLADLPLPDLGLIGGREGLSRYCGPYPRGPLPSMFVMASRGCFGRCKFCNTPVFWGRRVRTRPPASVVDEIAWLHARYGVREIYFQDDTFNANLGWAETVLNAIVERGLNRDIAYRLCFRVNEPLVTPGLLALAKTANVQLIFFGTESGNQGLLAAMGKDVRIEEIERAFRLAHEAGIRTVTSFLIGNAGETRQTVCDSIALARRLKAYAVGFSMAIPFPGTALRAEAEARGHLLEVGYDGYGAERGLLRTEALEPREMAQLQRYANACMLLQPSNVDYIFRPRSFFGVRTKLRVAREILAHRRVR